MSGVQPVADLATLKSLDPATLYVFVAGPGCGEGIAVAVPGGGWLVVDGCEVMGQSLMGMILTRWHRGAGDRLDGFVWTHAHEDHSGGVAEMLESHPPEWIGLAGDEAQARRGLGLLRPTPAGAHPAAANDRGQARLAAAKVEDLLHRGASVLQPMVDGTSIVQGALGARWTVRAPTIPSLDAVLRRWHAQSPIRSGLNEGSVVLELKWHDHRLVFGGDLPETQTQAPNARVQGGWSDVLARAPQLLNHSLLKVPHHGSRHALHSQLIAPSGQARDWLVTPYSTSRLPRLDVGDGLEQLVTAHQPVRLTALPVARPLQRPLPLRMTVSQLRQHVGGPPVAPTAQGSTRRVAPGAFQGDDTIWCVALHQSGVVGRWRGGFACEIVP